jgi:hypothetical protein
MQMYNFTDVMHFQKKFNSKPKQIKQQLEIATHLTSERVALVKGYEAVQTVKGISIEKVVPSLDIVLSGLDMTVVDFTLPPIIIKTITISCESLTAVWELAKMKVSNLQ